MSFADQAVTIAGAGPTGAMLAILLARRGVRVALYDSRPDPRDSRAESGRSINLALADRGIHALGLAGVLDQIKQDLVPMRGRFVHAPDGSGSLQPYGRLPGEVIYSVSRHVLNRELLTVALRQPGVEAHFEHRLEAADFNAGVARFKDLERGGSVNAPMRPLLAADGAGSTARRLMAARGLIEARESALEHGYKELSIPSGPQGRHRMEREALHIWPRGGYMLIALPNQDGSFTATLFLPLQGAVSFAALRSTRAIDDFLSANFADAHALMPQGSADFQRNPTGSLGTVYAAGWHAGGTAALIGDSAHAIVPFHGQGMNCCFEDCVEFDAVLAGHSSWEAVFADFYARRKPNTDAIAEMALDNYLEMRERVADPKFRLQQALALELESRYPQRFVPRYSMVMFHHEISYRTALQRGAVQARLLADLTQNVDTLAAVDYARAARCVEAELPALPALSNVMKL